MHQDERERLGRVCHEASTKYRIEKQFLNPPPEWERRYPVHQEELRVMAEAVVRDTHGRLIERWRRYSDRLAEAGNGLASVAVRDLVEELRSYLKA